MMNRKRLGAVGGIIFVVLFFFAGLSVRNELAHRVQISAPSPFGSGGEFVDQGLTANELVTQVAKHLKPRASQLMSQIRTGDLKVKNCSANHLHVVGPGVGSSTNQILTLAQALAVTTISSPELTLVVPGYMMHTIEQFDMTFLKELYCLEPSKVWTDADQNTLLKESSHKKKERERHQSILERVFSSFTCLFYDEVLVSGVTRKAGTTAGPVKTGDFFVSSRDLFFWGGDTYHGMGTDDERKVMAELITRELEGIGGDDKQYEINGGTVSSAKQDTGAHHVYKLSKKGTLEVATGYFDPKDYQSVKAKDKHLFSWHVSIVVAALWSSPRPELRRVVSSILQRKGMDNFSAVHRRGFEGTCLEGYKDHPVPELPEDEMPKDKDGNRAKEHPLCTLNPKFVRTWLGLIGENEPENTPPRPQHVFVASDGQEDDSKWLQDKDATVGWDVHSPGNIQTQDSTGSLADVLVATVAQGDFMGQPRSTYSLQIYILRMLIGRHNVMLGEGYDFYYRPGPTNWLSPSDFRRALQQFNMPDVPATKIEGM